MQKTLLIGYLGKDPEMKYTPDRRHPCYPAGDFP